MGWTRRVAGPAVLHHLHGPIGAPERLGGGLPRAGEIDADAAAHGQLLAVELVRHRQGGVDALTQGRQRLSVDVV